jgi:ubiquinone/menaquinone biosynthesis C-methylase UbiE
MTMAHGETAEEHAAAQHHQHHHHNDEHHDGTAHHALALPSPGRREREAWTAERVRCGRYRLLESGQPACGCLDRGLPGWRSPPGRTKIVSVGFYGEQILPRVQDKVMGVKRLREARGRVCGGLEGTVVEVGFGTGLNARYYPPEVTKVVAIEPSRVCMRIAEPRIAQSASSVEYGGLTGEQLDLPTGEFDMVLSTWTLCTIPNVDAALGEVRRVLRPGGSFHFIEHGHAPDENVARWQARIEPLWKPVAGGCHLTRRIADCIEKAGFEIERLDTYYFKGDPKPFGYTYEGQAISR